MLWKHILQALMPIMLAMPSTCCGFRKIIIAIKLHSIIPYALFCSSFLGSLYYDFNALMQVSCMHFLQVSILIWCCFIKYCNFFLPGFVYQLTSTMYCNVIIICAQLADFLGILLRLALELNSKVNGKLARGGTIEF